MGFINGRKKKENDDNEKRQETEQIVEASSDEEEDDFSVIPEKKHTAEKSSDEDTNEKSDTDPAIDSTENSMDGADKNETDEENDEQIEKNKKASVDRATFKEAAQKEFLETAQKLAAKDHDEEDDFGSDDYFDEDDFDNTFNDSDDSHDADPDKLSDDAGYDESSEEELKRKKQRKAKRYELKKKTVKVACFAAGILIAAAVGVYIYGYNSIPVNVISDNVYIETIDVSGLTYDEAVAKLNDSQLLVDKEITLVCGNNTYKVNGTEVGMIARVEDTVKSAMEYGKSGNKLADGFTAAKQVLFTHTITPKANVDEALLREKITEFGKQIYGERIEHTLELGDGVVIASAGKTGFDMNTDTAYQQIIDAMEKEQFRNIDVDLKSGPPEPLTVEKVDAFTYADPIDAYYQIDGNNIMVIAEVPGRYINKEEVANLITQVVEGAPNVNIPYYTSEAAIKASDLQSKLFNTTLASYSTNYGGSNANRKANVANAAGRINGKILAPGDVFSFNDVVGKRTVENGFKEATEYTDGQAVLGIGGGTCQVSSTLYNAVLYSDLGIVYRLNHMFPVSYCPLGQDATVADSGVDFKFVNDTDYPIKIVTSANGSQVTVSILGTQRDVPHTVKMENSTSAANGGTSVRTVRKVYDPNGNLIREENMGTSFYMEH